MTPDRTELEWTYQPDDLFEAPYRYDDTEYELLLEEGRAKATLRAPQDPVNQELGARIGGHVENLLLTRQLQVHRRYDLNGPRICQHVEGRRNVVIQVSAAEVVTVVGQVDIIVRDAAGNVVHDTRTERIADDTRLLDLIAPKMAQSPELREMVRSYSQSIADPSNELVHLYEVRDCLSNYYDGEGKAKAALNISNSEWSRVGRLANDEPVDQSRHRGKHLVGRRPASTTELEEVRGIVKRWITQFAVKI